MVAQETVGRPALKTCEEADDYVRCISDTIYDPCGMAMGLNVGMNEMGLIRAIESERDAAGNWSINVTLRLTSPGCEYFFAFKDNLQQRLGEHPNITSVMVEWDPTLDWTPMDLSPDARERLEQRRRELWSTRVLKLEAV